jgi:5-methylthioribose kinase
MVNLEHGATEYAALRLGLPAGDLRVTALGGGVSNHVVLVETGTDRFVLKQSLPQLRVEAEWFCARERVFVEAAVLRRLAPELPQGAVPEVLWEDRENFLYAMRAAPDGAVHWKSQLLLGEIDTRVARRAGEIHRAMLAASRASASWAEEFGDLAVFEDLRVDPYHRFTAARHPDLASHFDRAIERARNVKSGIVHGDWSPKNLMVSGNSVMAIDFECAHYGDAAFDLAFLLNHLLLKSLHRPEDAPRFRAAAMAYWSGLSEPALEAPALELLPLLLLARVDGKSPVEYITDSEAKEHLRAVARQLLQAPVRDIAALWERL